MGTLVKSGEMASLGGKVRYKGAFRPLLVCYGPIYVHGWPFMCTCSVKVYTYLTVYTLTQFHTVSAPFREIYSCISSISW